MSTVSTPWLRRGLRGMSVLALVGLLALLLAPLASADNVVNDVTAGGNDTFTAGGSATVDYKIVGTGGDSEAGCNATSGSPATVTINVPPDVTATPSSRTFTSCGPTQSVVFTSSVPGDYGITASVSDGGPGTYNTTPAAFTLHVLAPADSTPPVITPNIVPSSPDGTDVSSGTTYGWYISNVTVSWTVVDNESAFSSSGCDLTTINTDTAGQTITCSATSVGGSASNSVTILRDATNPDITFAGITGTAGDNGWYRSAVTVNWTCSDATSQPVATGVSQTLSTDGADQSATGTCADNAGNTSSDTQTGIDIDQAPPANVTFSAFASDQYFGFVDPAPTCSADDATSGFASCIVSGYSTSVGQHTLVATAKDNAGNTATNSLDYEVLAWTINGFYSPVNPAALNTVKAGSTVPLKFEVFAGATELTDTSLVTFRAAEVNCSNLEVTVQDPVDFTTTGGTSLRYDWTAGQFIQNWQTPKNKAGSCYRVRMTTADGSSIYADFKLK